MISKAIHATPSRRPTAQKGRQVRFSATARTISGVMAAITIVVSFVEAAVNPAASFSALHFWLALFVAAAMRGDEKGDPCRN